MLFGIVMLADFGARLFISNHRMARPAQSRTPGPTSRRSSRSWRRWPARPSGSCASCARCACCTLTSSSPGCAKTANGSGATEDVVLATVLNLAVFLFIMTGIVYETQHATNPAIGNYVDALYFTVTALTTTGFGDITQQGNIRPPDLGGDPDDRRDAVPHAGACSVATTEGAFPVPDLRAHVPMMPTPCTARPAGSC